LALPTNNGSWPNIIKFNIAGTNIFAIGQTTSLKYFYQFGQSSSQSADLRFYIDNDLNPWNGNATQIYQQNVFGSGTNFLKNGTFDFTPNPATSVPGFYAIYGKITFGGHTRYLYAPEIVQLKPSLQAPTLRQTLWANNRFQFNVSGYTGQNAVVQASTDLRAWSPLMTNTLTRSDWVFIDGQTATNPKRFYRVVLLP